MSEKNYDFDSFDLASNEPISDADMDTSAFDSVANDDETTMAAISGFGQGASFGFTDELSGALGAAYDAATQDPLLDETEFDQLKRAYSEYRDLARSRQRQLQEENPAAFTTGEILGGIATPLPAIGGAKVANTALKTGKGLIDGKHLLDIANAVKKGRGVVIGGELSAAERLANLGKTIGQGAALGTGVGAAAGAGYSEGDNVKEILGDTLDAAESGMVFGAAAPVAIKAAIGTGRAVKTGAKKAIDFITNDLDREAYRLGKKGVDISSPEFAQAHRAELTAESEKLAKAVEPVKTKAQSQIDKIQSDHQKQLDDYNATLEKYNRIQEEFKQGQISATDKSFTDVQEELIQKAKQLGKTVEPIKTKTQSQIDEKLIEHQNKINDYNATLEKYNKIQEEFKQGQSKSAEKFLQKAEIEIVDSSKKLQDDLSIIKKKLSDEYEDIYNKTKAVGVEVDLTQTIDNFIDNLSGPEVDSGFIERMSNDLAPYRGQVDFKKFQDFKQKLNKIINSGSYRNVGLAKKAYGESARAYESSLRNIGQNELADQLSHTNKQWATYSDMDDFIQSIAPDRHTGELYGDTNTIKTIRGLAQERSEDIAKSERFKDYANKLGLDISEQEKLSQKSKQLKEFKPTELEMPEVTKPEIDVSPLEENKRKLLRLQSYLERSNRKSLDKAKDLIKENPELFDEQTARNINAEIDRQEQLLQKAKQLKELKPTELEMPEVTKPEIDTIALEESKKKLSELQSYLGKGDKQSIDKARNLIVESSKLFGDPKKEQELVQIKDILDQAYGKESADEIFSNMKTLSERERIGRITHKETESPLTRAGAARAELGGAKEIKMKAANILGRTQKAIPEMTKRLTDKTPESIKSLANTIGAVAKPGYAELSNLLNRVAGSNETARQALLYTITQNPGYRQIIQEHDLEE